MARVHPTGMGGRSFHEAPLVLFTALATMGAGVGVAHLLGALLGAWTLPIPRSAALLLTGLMAAGLVASAGHLGRPLRGVRALRGVGTSPLSREVVAVGATVTAGAASVVLSPETVGAPWLGLLLSAASAATLVSLGLVYRLSHQPAWRGPALLHPLVLGSLWGWVALDLLTDAGVGLHATAGGWPLLGGALLAADATLWLLRVRGWSGARAEAEAHHPWAEDFRAVLTLGRLVMGTLLPLGLLLAGLVWAALLSLTLGVVLDRLAFYALALRRSTEAEVARVEAML